MSINRTQSEELEEQIIDLRLKRMRPRPGLMRSRPRPRPRPKKWSQDLNIPDTAGERSMRNED